MTHLSLILAQCEHQQATSPRQIAGFAVAYMEALSRVDDVRAYTADDWLESIHAWAELIEPGNETYRTTPVTFRGGGTGLPADQIERQMDILFEHDLSPVEIYRQFEEIHPYKDGNGRIGHLIWALATVREGKEWPMELPPNLWG